MHLTKITSARKAGFKRKVLHRRKEPRRTTAAYLKQKSSFFVASLSLMAFIAGNMMGQHGWYAFWKATLGKYDDSLITYTGTVTPVAFVPDYEKWAKYGGNAEDHFYREVPKDALVPLPSYDQLVQRHEHQGSDVYSVGNMGAYDTGAEGEGSHPGVDIRVPEGTPIRAIANGIVTSVREDIGGFGKLVVIRHPHMPDPSNPKQETVLHSVYAHLSAQLVVEGDVVQKGQQIALSGQTGFATGPHLHFQVDRDTAPWHPYWPFTGAEAREAGLTLTQAINTGFHQERLVEYTVHPMLLVQTDAAPVPVKDRPTTVVAQAPKQKLSPKELREARRQTRLARQAQMVAARPVVIVSSSSSAATNGRSEASIASSAPSVIVEQQTVAGAETLHSAPVMVLPASARAAVSVDIQHARKFEGRTWEKVRLTLLDDQGNTTSENGLSRDIVLRTAYGEAEFRPASLSALDFKNGVAEVEMLPRGRRTVVIQVEPFQVLGRPMEYGGK